MGIVIDEDMEIKSLLSEAGVASHGERLIAAVEARFPPELQKAQELKVNPALTPRLNLAVVADHVDAKVQDAVVVGGEMDPEDAYVRWVGLSEDDDTVKGAFRLSELEDFDADEGVAGDDSSDEVAALKARIQELQEAQSDPEPYDGYKAANAADIIAALHDADASTAEAVKTYEQAHGDRSTVVKAADKRLEDLEAEESARAAAVEENEKLKARIQELEDAQASGEPPAEPPAA